MNKLYNYKLPLKNGTYRDGIIVETATGYGDIAPLPGFSRETLADARDEAIRLLPDFPNCIPTLPSVRFAFDCAQVPLTSVKVPVNALNEYRNEFVALKIKVGHLSVEQAVLLSKKVPKNCALRLDFNRQWSLEKLLQFSSHFSPDDFEYLEEPTAQFSDLLLFSRKTGFPIAVDESIPYVPYWEIPTLKALVIKPTILGTIPKPPPGVELIFSSAFESGIGVLHIARLAEKMNPNRPHGLDPYTHLLEDLLTPKPKIENGLFEWTGSPIIKHGSLCLLAK